MYIGQSEWRAGSVGALSVSPYKAVHRCTQDSQNGGRGVWGPYRSHRIRPFIGVHRTVRMEGGECGGLIGLTV